MSQAVEALNGAEEVVWDLGDLYASPEDPAITRDLEAAAREAEEFAGRYRGRVAELSVAQLAQALTEAEARQERIGRLASFAYLNWTTDTANPTFGALLQRVRETLSRLSQQTLFFELEWAALSEEQAQIMNAPELARWKHYLESERKMRPHLLTEPEEKILTEKQVTGAGAWSRFYNETVNSIEYTLDGETRTQAEVLRLLYHADREVRRRAADSVTSGLRTYLRPITYIFNTLLADKHSNDRLRRFPTWISSRNLYNETTDEAVEALVKAVTGRYDLVARYYRVKRKELGYDELYDYDRYAPLAQAETTYRWSEARALVESSFEAFSPRLAEIAREFFDRGWIHAAVRPGKLSGAFAHPAVPSHHPYLLVNYTGVSRDVMTLAHEMGHGVHMYLARPKGVFACGTPLTTAEMASVFGETLVFHAMLERERDPRVRLSMLAGRIEDTFATVFRQISMNRFEEAIHTARRTQGELTTEQFNALWLQTQREQFGDSVTLRDDYGIWWSYISHFINAPGYVYAYAFGELLTLALYNRYRQEGASFVPKYLEVLAAGGSDSPERILAHVGVDLNDPAFWQEGLSAIEAMVSEVERMTA